VQYLSWLGQNGFLISGYLVGDDRHVPYMLCGGEEYSFKYSSDIGLFAGWPVILGILYLNLVPVCLIVEIISIFFIHF